VKANGANLILPNGGETVPEKTYFSYQFHNRRPKIPIKFNSSKVYFVVGQRGAGKSVLLEVIAERYLENGDSILDLFGASSGEGLAWLRSPWVEEDNRVLLIKGGNVDVQCSWNAKVWGDLALHDLETNRFVISATPLYYNWEEEYLAIAKIMDLIADRHYYSKMIYMLVREGGSLFYSTKKLEEKQLITKIKAIYALRQARHHGTSMGLDIQRFPSIDADIRSMADYVFIKALGIEPWPKDHKWIFKYFKPARVLRSIPPNKFFWFSAEGALGKGENGMVAWHKRQNENILKALDIRVEKGEIPVEALDRGSYKTVGSQEHAMIIKKYIEEGIGMIKIARQLGRSTATVHLHIRIHNEAIQRSGFCPLCKSVNGEYQNTRTKTLTEAKETKAQATA